MKLSKGKINRIINKKKNSKNIKKRKYKRTDTCNNKAKRHFPAEGQSTLSGIIVEADLTTGLAIKVDRFIYGGVLNN